MATRQKTASYVLAIILQAGKVFVVSGTVKHSKLLALSKHTHLRPLSNLALFVHGLATGGCNHVAVTARRLRSTGFEW